MKRLWRVDAEGFNHPKRINAVNRGEQQHCLVIMMRVIIILFRTTIIIMIIIARLRPKGSTPLTERLHNLYITLSTGETSIIIA